MVKKRLETDKPSKSAKKGTSIKKTNILIYIFIVALVIYITVLLVDQNVKIQNARDTLSDLKTQKSMGDIELAELKTVADSAEKEDYDSIADYIAKMAREMDYVKSGEVVYINTAGN